MITMSKDESVQIALEAWNKTSKRTPFKGWFEDNADWFEAFAKLVAAKEREACAVIAEEWFCGCGRGSCSEGDRRAHDIADSIRARDEA